MILNFFLKNEAIRLVFFLLLLTIVISSERQDFPRGYGNRPTSSERYRPGKSNHRKRRRQTKPKQCKLFATKWGVSGWNDNEIKYFNKHQIKCPKNYALKYVRLFTDKKRAKIQKGAWSMRFKFICCKIKAINCVKKNTKYVAASNSFTLARIGKVDCGCEKVITKYHIQVKYDQYGKTPMSRVSYSCCNFYQHGLKRFKIVKKTSGYRDSGEGRIVFLDRHPINCGKKGFISNITARTKAKNESGHNPYFKINYTCLIPVIGKRSKRKGPKKGKHLSKKKRNKKIRKHMFSIQRLLRLHTKRIPNIRIDNLNRKICFTY